MAKNRVQVIIPTAINVLTATNEVLITRSKNDLTAQVDLPSLRRRALMIIKEQGVMTVQLDVPSDTTNYTR